MQGSPMFNVQGEKQVLGCRLKQKVYKSSVELYVMRCNGEMKVVDECDENAFMFSRVDGREFFIFLHESTEFPPITISQESVSEVQGPSKWQLSNRLLLSTKTIDSISS